MGRTAETPLPVPDDYREMVVTAINAAVKKHGSQEAVAALVGTDQATVSRMRNPKLRYKGSYTTWKKFADALGLPEPAICVRSPEHYEWCALGDILLQLDEAEFKRVLENLRREVRLAHMDATSDGETPQLDNASFERLKSLITHPLPGR